MSYLSQFSSHLEGVLRSGHFRAKTRLYGAYACSWSRRISCNRDIAPVNLNSGLNSLGARLYSSRRSGKAAAQSRGKSKPATEMEKEKETGEKEKEEFYVVRKGDAIGVYKSFVDCQAQAGSSICDPPISVFKGYNLPKNTEEFLAARGLRNAIYTISTGDLKEGLFGNLVQCSLQDPTSVEDTSKKRSQVVSGIEYVEPISSIAMSSTNLSKHAKLDHSDYRSCIIKFDGASKGNPGSSGAGVVMLADNGNLICKLREGVGVATNNVAEYRGLLLGLKYALEKGFEKVTVFGDSKLVYMQVQGLWKAKHKNLIELHEEALKLKDQFKSFEIHHVLRGQNADADAQANLGVTLYNGEVVQDE